MGHEAERESFKMKIYNVEKFRGRGINININVKDKVKVKVKGQRSRVKIEQNRVVSNPKGHHKSQI